MSYQVLARKWRPRTFADVAGQGHVLKALVNALDNDRLHHAYLFTGTRGVGKTTLARIFAKALNCERGVSSTPCGECSICREIDEGRFMELIEVDAASKTKVEDTRELLDNVQYAPVSGRFKIYLIDEVHMLSKHSFNALLKTLEEPPPYVKFLLATTDPQKLPVTVLSRCLQFNLRRLPVGLIRDYLRRLMEAEGIAAEDGALLAIARAADGSMRDALSLLDQAIAFGAGGLGAADVHEMLGTIDDRSLEALISALADGDGDALLAAIDEMAMRTHDFSDDYMALLDALMGLLHRIALAQVVPASLESLDEDRELVRGMAERITPETVQLYYQIGLTGRRDLPLAPDPRIGLEMTLLRMLAFRPVGPADDGPPSPPQARGRHVEAAAGSAAPRPVPGGRVNPESAAGASSTTAPDPVPAARPPGPGPVGVAEPAPATDAADWSAIVERLGLTGIAQQLATHCSLVGIEGAQVELRLDGAHAHLRSAAAETRLAEALSRHLGQDVRLAIHSGRPVDETPAARRERIAAERRQAAVEAITNDPTVRRLQETFSARILNETIAPPDGD